MDTIPRIIKQFGGSTALARETGFPVQTVNDWKKNGNIPHWRREKVLDAARRAGVDLDPDLIAYLVSSESLKKAAVA